MSKDNNIIVNENNNIIEIKYNNIDNNGNNNNSNNNKDNDNKNDDDYKIKERNNNFKKIDETYSFAEQINLLINW